MNLFHPSVVLAAALFLSMLSESMGIKILGSTQQKPRGPDRQLTAEDVAQKYLPAVVLIVSRNAEGEQTQGSGFLVAGNLALTNYHVVEGMVRGLVKLPPLVGRKRTTVPITSIVDFDRNNDLALLSIDGQATQTNRSVSVLPEAAELAELANRIRGLGNEPKKAATPSDDPLGIHEFLELESIPCLAPLSRKINIGETIYVLGNPEGLVGSISRGIVSGLRRVGPVAYIQITAPVSSGSSGGPVINTRGEVIGIVVGTMREGQNLNFAMPSNSARKLRGFYGRCNQTDFSRRS